MSDEATITGETAAAGASGSAGYEVEGEPGVYWCARHSKVRTRLRCGRCEKPICPKCTTMGPTGARCPQCSSRKSMHMYQVKPQHYLAAVIVSVLLGVVSGYVAKFLFIFALLYAPAAGTMMAKAISAVAGNKRGTPLAVIASAGLVIGVLIAVFAPVLGMIGVPAVPIDGMPGTPGAIPSTTSLLFDAVASDPLVWLYLALAVPSVWYWLK